MKDEYSYKATASSLQIPPFVIFPLMGDFYYSFVGLLMGMILGLLWVCKSDVFPFLKRRRVLCAVIFALLVTPAIADEFHLLPAGFFHIFSAITIMALYVWFAWREDGQ